MRLGWLFPETWGLLGGHGQLGGHEGTKAAVPGQAAPKGDGERPPAPLPPSLWGNAERAGAKSAPGRVPSKALGLGWFVGLKLAPVKPSQLSPGAEVLCSLQGSQLPTCTMQDQTAAAAVQCWGGHVGPPPSTPWGADRVSASHPDSPVQASWPSSTCPLRGQNHPGMMVSGHQGFQAPHLHPNQGSCNQGSFGEQPRRWDRAEDRLAMPAPSTGAVKAPCPAAGTRPSP